jgi:predicted DNA-binding transcriptional regulator AlpA
MAEPEYMGTSELAQRTGIAESTWRHFAATNQGPPSIKVGKRRLYRWPDVQAWLEAHQEQESEAIAP